ncbi:MAG TPA: ATP-binding protein, partial [Balneolaceae bacterium]|nr:ATP-binding protein [Balneolaceae bacterium]
AFANDVNNWGGGYIIVGVAEKNGRPVLPPTGLDPNTIDDIQKKLLEISHKIQPNYMPIVQPYVKDGKHILVAYAPAGDVRPYSAPEGLGKKSSKNRNYYIRKSSNTVAARGESLRQLQALAARIPFDDRINHEAELNDLNLGVIREFLQDIGSELYEESASMPFEDLCRQMAIAKGPDEALKPINAGLMFFCKEPHRFFKRAWIEVVLRTDEAGTEFTEKYFKGPLHKQLQDALGFIKSNIIEEKTQKIEGQAEARRFVNYPFEAVEEALANAVYHKSYELGSPIEVQIWPNRMEILSYPGPVPPVDAKILEEHRRIVARDYRNRRVGDFLKELHLTEGRGTGIPIIYDVMEKNGSPEPDFKTDEACTYFLTVLYSHPELILGQSDQDSDQATDQDGDQATDQELKVLELCRQPHSRKEILEELGLSNHQYNYQRHIEPLLERNWLELTVPDKPKSPNQKYKTTKKGLNALQSSKNS